MLTAKQTLELAQALQPQLHDLIQDVDRADAIDRELTDLLTRYHSGEDVADDLFDLMHDQPELSSYFLPSPPETYISKGVPLPPGNSPPVPASEPIPFKGMKVDGDPPPLPASEPIPFKGMQNPPKNG